MLASGHLWAPLFVALQGTSLPQCLGESTPLADHHRLTTCHLRDDIHLTDIVVLFGAPAPRMDKPCCMWHYIHHVRINMAILLIEDRSTIDPCKRRRLFLWLRVYIRQHLWRRATAKARLILYIDDVISSSLPIFLLGCKVCRLARVFLQAEMKWVSWWSTHKSWLLLGQHCLILPIWLRVRPIFLRTICCYLWVITVLSIVVITSCRKACWWSTD